MAEAVASFDDLVNRFGLKPRIAAARKFRKLSAIVLASMQEELCEFERLLEIKPGCGVASPATSNVSVASQQVTSHARPAELAPVDAPTLEDVRRKLEVYHEFLLRFIEVHSLQKLDHIDFDDLKSTVGIHPSVTQNLEPWDHKDDLVGLFTQHDPKRDRFTKWIIAMIFWFANKQKGQIRQSVIEALEPILPKSWIQWISNLVLPPSDESSPSPDEVDESITINEERIANVIAVANVFIASSLNVSSMFALYAVESTWRRIGMIVAFTFLFTTSTIIFTTAEPAIVYASTAAYSAVLVVFVGNVN